VATNTSILTTNSNSSREKSTSTVLKVFGVSLKKDSLNTMESRKKSFSTISKRWNGDTIIVEKIYMKI
jgi:hypothetical protein